MAMLAPDGRLLRTNTAYRARLGLPDDLPAGFRVQHLPLTGLGDSDEPLFEQLRDSHEPMTVTRPFQRHDDGSTIRVEVHATGLRDQRGEPQLMFVPCLDVTRLLSRSAFEEDPAALLADRPEPACAIYRDVDRFKSINDGSGHSAGDGVLRAIASGLRDAVPPGTLVARLGGDEFVVALSGGPDIGIRVGHTILAACAEPGRSRRMS